MKNTEELLTNILETLNTINHKLDLLVNKNPSQDVFFHPELRDERMLSKKDMAKIQGLVRMAENGIKFNKLSTTHFKDE